MSALRSHMTARELAEMALPGMPTTRRRVRELAKREGWKSRERQGVGGGVEYAISSLPATIKIHIAQLSRRAALMAETQTQKAVCASRDDVRNARVFILDEIDELCEYTASSRHQATEAYLGYYKSEHAPVPDWVKAAVPKLNARTIRSWITKRERGGNDALKDMRRGPRNTSIFDKDANLAAYILSQVTARPHIKATTLRKGLIAEGFESVPSVRYLQKYLADWKNEKAREFLAISNPDAYRSKYEAAFGSRSADVTRVNERWEVDGTLADIMCVMPNGEERRYALTGMIDVYSRRSKVIVSRQPSAVTVSLLLRKCALDWGLPETLKADNGKDYTASHVSRIAADLGFNIKFCTPFRPMEKPHIERFFGTMTRSLFEMLPGYIGHNINDRKAIESRQSFAQRFSAIKTHKVRVDGGELQAIIDEWIETDYEQSVHKGIKTTPFLKAQESKLLPRIPHERALDILLAASPGKDGIRVIQKDGIHVNARVYIAVELAAMIGDRVHVKFDPEDVSKIIVYNADRSEFICVAEDPTMSDMDRQDIAKRSKQAQHQEHKVFTSELKAAQAAHNPDNLAASILASKARDKGESKVVQFRPGPAAPQSPAFVRERKAVAAMNAPAIKPAVELDEETLEVAAREFAVLDARAAPKVHYVTRADGSERPVFMDDFKFAEWIRDQDETHPEDVEDLRDLLTNGTGRIDQLLRDRLAGHGLEPYVTQLFKDMEP